jgi:hypothetical protein
MRIILLTAAGMCLLVSTAWAQTPSPPPAGSPPQTTAPGASQPGSDDGRSQSMMPSMDQRGMGGMERGGPRGAMDHGGVGMMGQGGNGQAGMGMMGGMGMMPMMRGKGPFFAFRPGQGSFMIKCAADESTKACVDAILPLLDKVHSMHPMGAGQP